MSSSRSHFKTTKFEEVFGTLRRVGKIVDKDVAELLSRIQDFRFEASSHDRRKSLEELENRLKEFRKIVDRDRIVDCLRRQNDFSQFVLAIEEGISSMEKEMKNIVDFLKQYGYVPTVKTPNKTDVKVDSVLKDATASKWSTPCIPIRYCTNLDPQLQFVSSSLQSKDHLALPMQYTAQPLLRHLYPSIRLENWSSTPSTLVRQPPIYSTPTPFRNTGICVTPELFQNKSTSAVSSHLAADKIVPEGTPEEPEMKTLALLPKFCAPSYAVDMTPEEPELTCNFNLIQNYNEDEVTPEEPQLQTECFKDAQSTFATPPCPEMSYKFH